MLPPSLPRAFSTSTKSFCLPQKQPFPKYIGVTLSLLAVLVLVLFSALVVGDGSLMSDAARTGVAVKLRASTAARACCVKDRL